MPVTHTHHSVRTIFTVSIDGKPYAVNMATRVTHTKDNTRLPFEAYRHLFLPDHRELVGTIK